MFFTGLEHDGYELCFYETCMLEDYDCSYFNSLNYGLLFLSYVFISVHISFLNFCVFLLLSFKYSLYQGICPLVYFVK